MVEDADENGIALAVYLLEFDAHELEVFEHLGIEEETAAVEGTEQTAVVLFTTGSSWKISPTRSSCLPPKGSRMLRQYTRNILSRKSMISARTILISSMMMSSTSRIIFIFSELYFRVLRMLRTEYMLSLGSSGWKGSLKKLWSVLPPALMAAMPVGARMICFFLVLAAI